MNAGFPRRAVGHGQARKCILDAPCYVKKLPYSGLRCFHHLIPRPRCSLPPIIGGPHQLAPE
jgi:hypothetical protein